MKNSRPMSLNLLTLLVGTLSTLHCADPSGPSSTVTSPGRQFTMTTIQIEERRQGETLWTGKAASSEGDFAQTSVKDLVLTRPAQGPGQTVFTVASPSADLNLAQGVAHFKDVRIEDSAGRTLNAGQAHYSEANEAIEAEGPTLLQATEMQVSGTRARLNLVSGALHIEGPIVGTLTPPTPPQSPPKSR